MSDATPPEPNGDPRLDTETQWILDAIDRDRDLANSHARDVVLDGWRRGIRAVRSLHGSGVTLDQIQRLAFAHLGFEFVRLEPGTVNSDALAAVPSTDVHRVKAIPFAIRDGVLHVAVVSPIDRVVTDEVRTWAPNVRLAVADETAIQGVLSYMEDAERLAGMEDVDDDFDDDVDDEEDEDQGRYAVVARQIVEQAVVVGASDIHIEPEENAVRIRYRIDGVLHTRSTFPGSMTQGLINRFKVKARLDLGNNNRTPQDGRFTSRLGGKRVDMRVNVCPTKVGAEQCVMRLLDTGAIDLDITKLLTGPAQQPFLTALKRPHGLVAVTGPTGSGKSTMLAASLASVTDETVKVITVEDPVEYNIPGAVQVEVNPRQGFTFPVALRSILRSDPDIILIGEIRDTETAEIAVSASQTGHLVLASLHVNTAFEAPARLIDMGIEPFLVASTLSGVLNQRLPRRLCPHCKELVPLAEAIGGFQWPEDLVQAPAQAYRAVGDKCEHCSGTGFRGRFAIAEFLPVNEKVRRVIVERGTPEEIEEAAKSSGAVTIIEHGLHAVVAGDTTVDEIFRVVVED